MSACCYVYTHYTHRERERSACVCVLYNEARLSYPELMIPERERPHTQMLVDAPVGFRAAKKQQQMDFPFFFFFIFFYFIFISTSFLSNNPVRPTSVVLTLSLTFLFFTFLGEKKKKKKKTFDFMISGQLPKVSNSFLVLRLPTVRCRSSGFRTENDNNRPSDRL